MEGNSGLCVFCSWKRCFTSYTVIRLFILLYLLVNVSIYVESTDSNATNKNATSTHLETNNGVAGFLSPDDKPTPFISGDLVRTDSIHSKNDAIASSKVLALVTTPTMPISSSQELMATSVHIIEPSASIIAPESQSVSDDRLTSSRKSVLLGSAMLQTSTDTLFYLSSSVLTSLPTEMLTSSIFSINHLIDSSISVKTMEISSTLAPSVNESGQILLGTSAPSQIARTTMSHLSTPLLIVNSTVFSEDTDLDSATAAVGNSTSVSEVNSTTIPVTSLPPGVNSTTLMISTPATSAIPTNTTPIFVVKSTFTIPVANYTTSSPVMNSTSGVVMNSTSVVMNSISVAMNSTSVVMNSTSVVIVNLTSVIVSSTIPLSSMVCPTTTVYINCSTAIIEPSTSFFFNFSSIIVSPTVNRSSSMTVINYTSTTMNASVITSTMNSSAMFTTIVSSSSASILSSSLNHSSIHITPSENITSVAPTTTAAVMSPTPTPNSTFISSSLFSSILNSSFHISTISPSSSSSVIVSSSAFVPPVSVCDRFLSDFSDAYVALTRCMLRWMHPMRVCSNCSAEYNSFAQHHKKIFVDCGQTLVYQYNLKYQVIPKMFHSLQNNWKSLECEKCYVENVVGKKSEYSNDFKNYIRLYEQLTQCFVNHTIDSGINGSMGNVSYDRSICTECAHLYNQMQRSYEYYGDDGQDTRWCADINFAVNETRHRWSNEFKCVHKAKDLESVIALTVFFCFLPIVFYVGAKLHADVRERKKGHHYHYESE